MAGKVKAIPDGYTAVTPYLTIKDAAKAIEFYRKAFGAEELFRMPMPDGKTIAHAELQIGNGRIMLSEEFPGQPGCAVSPTTAKTTTSTVHLYVDDCDAAFKQAVNVGATAAMPPMDMFWGDRFAKVVDPFGHHWSIATHVRDVSPDEMAEAAKHAFAEMAGG
jgi:PhnB protein